METIQLCYSLLKVRGIGRVKANEILQSIADLPSNAVDEIFKSFLENLNKDQGQQFKELACSDIDMVSSYGVENEYISLLDSLYPNKLKKNLGWNAPTVLSYRGNLSLLDKKSVAFSGSRKVSEKGIEITKDCVEQLVNQGVCIVSGYAKGVDETAHYTALQNGGSTIIVLSEGIENFRIKKIYKDVWDWDRVLVISEFLPDDAWRASRAMQRNDTIIALSDSVIVIEAGETGGSYDAGIKTLEKNKRLFVTQYAHFPESALGNRKLIAKNAIPLMKSKETMRVSMKKIFDSLENMYIGMLF